MTQVFELQLNDIVSEYETTLDSSHYSDASDVLTDTQVADMRTRCIAAIGRAADHDSVYYREAMAVREQKGHVHHYLRQEIGVANGLLSDIRQGYMSSLKELLHSNLFGDFIEMARYLLDNGYKDAAAALVGGTLEIHLRQLCDKHNIPTQRKGKPKKTDELNAELAKQSIYGNLDQKNVTAWLDLRNKAAHGYADILRRP